MLGRRQFLRRTGLTLVGAIAAGLVAPTRWDALAAPSAQGFGPPVADPQGLIDLPPGFRYTVLIRSGDEMTDGRPFPPDPDLGVIFDQADGTTYLAIGHEIRADLEYEGRFTGSITRLHLGPDNQVLESRLLADGMRNNCSGSGTPWGTVLSAEESQREPYEQYPDEGYIWEIDVRTGEKWRRDGMGRFSHESTAVDPETGDVYCTADFRGGAFYKFVPERAGDLSSGTLHAYRMDTRSWVTIDNPYDAHREALAKGATPFNRHEDLEWGRDGKLYIAETGNTTGPTSERDLFGRIRRFDPRTLETDVFVEGGVQTLIMPDNITVDRAGNFFVCEDKAMPMAELTGENNVVLVTPEGGTTIFATTRNGAEPSGVVFSPDYRTLYLNILEAQGQVLAITGF
jgi:uncharacterized protein